VSGRRADRLGPATIHPATIRAGGIRAATIRAGGIRAATIRAGGFSALGTRTPIRGRWILAGRRP
jgi:hypothetical protein